jgi:Sigma-70 region 2
MDEAASMDVVQAIIGGLVRRFHHRWPGLDRQELHSEAQPVALRAIRSYDPEKGMSLTSWVHLWVLRFFQTGSRDRAWRRRFSRQAHLHLTDDYPETLRFNLDRLLLEISEDAATAVYLSIRHGFTNRRDLIDCLLNEFGWAEEQVTAVFREVRRML